ncbi:MAG: DNA-directed RNA polymerase subunit beta [Atopobiaceae bacterium]|nr:DNA-directed RNA polymerase subunit beta [Atopobiaceae bacterium]MCH4119745.1 DNA-directed RNA polymerase subunit beta [Atopobiaceae bacterium]MCI1388819.1 DNA-directed RNA polymerase subunit beta [Atopobiaceae bacterium]MCI1432561.1 DNA-directed RNA polymerase subunit beta [Atopobiaceae bacterium]MCI1471102.1 DNA-directed RNA polymerase subunit beta [Atopobiaceae bacterium]
MPTAKSTPSITQGKHERVSFGKIADAMPLPNLISVQKESFERFKTEGLAEAFEDASPIENNAGTMELIFGDHMFGDAPASIEECRAKDMSYQQPLFVKVRFVNKVNGEVKEELVFMGDFPVMTDRGTFIINGTERVVVSQLVRSPGVYFSEEMDNGVLVHRAQFIPTRGAWLEFEVDKRGQLVVSIDRKRHQSATVLLRALGIAESDDEIRALLGDSDIVEATLEKDVAQTREDALIDIYRHQRPGEPPTVDSARALLDGLYFNSQRYDLARVGRFKINKKLDLDVDPKTFVLTAEDIVTALRYLLALHAGDATKTVDDIDHFGNRRVRTVGELVQNQFRIGMSRMERVVRERMASQDADYITPQSLINIRPIVAAIKEFFGSSQLSQFMDQSNPLAGLTHKRRLSALGPGGLAGHKSGSSRRTNVPTAVRDVHNSHYSRMCPIETPEGPNIGLIGSLALYAHVNNYGFIEAPYRKVVDGVVTDDIVWLTADEEEGHNIAPANTPVDPKSRRFVVVDPKTGELVEPEHVVARTRDFDGSFGAPAQVDVADVDLMDVSPRQLLSVAATLIPFLEHDDAKRTLMGANMQRQAVPLIRPTAPYVGTGMESRAALDSGEIICSHEDGTVVEVDAAHVVVEGEDKQTETYNLPKYERSNQSTCINHRPIVHVGEHVAAGQPIADGPSIEDSELALGTNLTVAYMPWEGFNYEDGIIISDRVVQEDLLTSVNISRHEIDSLDTKLGPEEITREIPNLSEDMLADLDEDGIIRIGAEVGPGDILVGKVTPKGETALTAEERLLRAIFGAKAHDVRDTSLKMPHGAYGRVVDVVRFSREAGDDLPPGVNELVRVYVAQRRKIQQGDKVSGRHGNKGVICKVLPIEDMPYMADGTPIDVLLDPLGVPSRMNVGQLLECHLGWAASHGWDRDSAESERYVPGPVYVASPVFDGATDEEVAEVLRRTNRNLMNKAREEYGEHMRDEFVPQLNELGKTTLYDGRTGEPFREKITVGTSYILKLGHMVDDKIHARSTGPYSLVTQQPLGGKAQFGGQRFGEMEVWALYAYGASNVLHELMTVKSDDTNGRVKTYEAIVKGENVPTPGIPESFKVLVKEIRSLALNIEPISHKARARIAAQEAAAAMADDLIGTGSASDLLDDVEPTDEELREAESLVSDIMDKKE